MGGQLDKRMLHWQPATCCIFQLFIIICHLANKVLLLLQSSDVSQCVLYCSGERGPTQGAAQPS